MKLFIVPPAWIKQLFESTVTFNELTVDNWLFGVKFIDILLSTKVAEVNSGVNEGLNWKEQSVLHWEITPLTFIMVCGVEA